MKTKRLWLAWIMSGMAYGMMAQTTALKAMADGHYQGAKVQLERFLQEECDENRGADVEALMLVCDYVTGMVDTSDKIAEWQEENSTSQYADVMGVLRRNLLIKEGRTDEALELFFGNDGSGIETPLAYPLTRLSEEMNSYNDVLYRLAGERLYDEGQYGRALTYLEAGEKTRTSQYKQGMCYYKTGQYKKAFTTLVESAGVEEDEMAQNAWLHAGIAALQTGEKSNARKAFFLASESTANPALREQALYNYCLTLHEGNAPETVQFMEQFLQDFPTSQYATPVSQCLSEVYMTKKDYTKALNALNKVKAPNADTQTDRQKVLYNLAFQELNASRVQQAATYASQAVALGNQDAEAYAESYYIKGDCNYRLGNYMQAANDLNTAINLGGSTASGRLKNYAYAIYTFGYAQFKQQKYNAAIVQFQKVTELQDVGATMRADAYNRMGDCYLNMRNYADASACYGRAQGADHSQGDYSMMQLAYIEGLKGNYDSKVQILQQMQAEYSQSSLGAKAMYEQGRAYVLSGNTDEATAVFGSLVARYPQSEYAQKAGEELQTMAANIAMQDSIAAAQEAVAIEAAKAPVEAAQALFDAGQYQQAEQQLNAAIDAGIGKPYWLARAFVLLSDIYRAEGREVEARQTLESLKANYKENDDIIEMIKQRTK